MRNKLSDLNNYLFEALERINDDELTEDDLTALISRTKTQVDVAEQIITIANLQLNAVKFAYEVGTTSPPLPKLFLEE